jgi:pimeloyl-ACP methyl ester carboxylesterase
MTKLACAVLSALLLSARCMATNAMAEPTASAPPPLKINLDAFDAMRKIVLLPNGEHLAYIDTGDPTGKPVVLIHGYTDNAREWVPLIPYLSKQDRLIVVDIRGHGDSDKPECCYARIDFAYDIKLLLDALHLAQADVVGHSMGSLITQVLAEEWPGRVRRVVLISSTAGPRAGAPPRKPKFDFASQILQLREPLDPDSPFMIAWWASQKPVDPEFIRRQRRDAARIPLSVWLAVLDQGATFADLQRTLPKLRASALLIWGSEDSCADCRTPAPYRVRPSLRPRSLAGPHSGVCRSTGVSWWCAPTAISRSSRILSGHE